MINVKLKQGSDETYLSEKIKSPIVIEEQLDTSLDGGTLSYLSNELPNSALNEPLAGYTIDIEYDNEGDTEHKKFDFVGMDSRAVIRKNYVQHTVKDTSAIETVSGPAGWYKASGKIRIEGFNIRILSYSGSVGGVLPLFYYSNNEITWSATWFSNRKPPSNYTITIVYVSNDDNIYSHQVALTEPSKLLQGVMIDGFGVSQPEDYSSRKTLQDVVERLLTVTPFDGQRFTLTDDDTVVEALQAVKSPQFKWNTQTTLWECLLQVGAVIDAMPRLVADMHGNYTVVTFDFVNAFVGDEEYIDDAAANAFGENVNETQYNTALSAIVENLRESE